MDFDNAKENIQPLSSGRNATILQAVLTSNVELSKMRESYESAIHQYGGEDPLEPWFEYIFWIEQSYPSGGNESGLKKVLLKCLERFESDQRYFQDRRMIRIYIKYIDTEGDPQTLYEELYKAGVGTMVADLYICWAFYYDLLGNFQKTEKIFQLGIRAKAQPYDELQHAHKHFCFTMSQRLLYQYDESTKEDFSKSLRERRYALTSLRSHRKLIGSLRTGEAVKTIKPGRIESDPKKLKATKNHNVNVNVYEDQNYDPNVLLPSEEPRSIVRNIIDSAREQENLREPGPWNNHNFKQKGNLIINNIRTSHFAIMEDDDALDNNVVLLPITPDNYKKGIILPKNFAIKNFPQSEWFVEPVTETEMSADVIAIYPKFYCYPNVEKEFSLEEYMAYVWFRKRKPDNNFIQIHSIFWGNDYLSNIRLFPNFPKMNIPDKNHLELSKFNPFKDSDGMTIDPREIYKNNDEKQMEEIFAEQWLRIRQQRGECTILTPENIDETVCGIKNEVTCSIFPSRKSMGPAAMLRKSGYFLKNEIKSFNLPRKKNSPSIEHSQDYSNVQVNFPEQNELKDSEFFENNQLKASKINVSHVTLVQNKCLNQEVDNNNLVVYMDKNGDNVKNAPSPDQKSELKLEPSKANNFKIPLPKKSLKLKAPFQIYQDDDECITENYFAPNETFSTQTFNSNIKTQSVSTPISNKCNKFSEIESIKSPESVSEELSEPQIKYISSTSDGESTEFTKPLMVIEQKQLSVIMETSETNTNTKSSVEAHETDDSSKTKICPSLMIPKDTTLDTLPDYRCLGAKPKKLSYHITKDDKKTIESDESNPRADLKSSIMIFEDKTETVPKTILRKTQEMDVSGFNNESSFFEDSKVDDIKYMLSIKQNSDFNSGEVQKFPLIAGNMTTFPLKLQDLTLPEHNVSNNKLTCLINDSHKKNDLKKTKNVALLPVSHNKSTIFEQSKVNDNKLISFVKQKSNFKDENVEKLLLITGDVTVSPLKLNNTLPEFEVSNSQLKSLKKDSYENIYDFFRTSPSRMKKFQKKDRNDKMLKTIGVKFDESLALPILNLENTNIPKFENEASKITPTKDNFSITNSRLKHADLKNTSIKKNCVLNSSNQTGSDFHVSHINEKSLHIKNEIIDKVIEQTSMHENEGKKSILKRFAEIKLENSIIINSTADEATNTENHKSKRSEPVILEEENNGVYPDVKSNDELSIYYDHTPKLVSVWTDDEHSNNRSCNFFTTRDNVSVEINYSNPFSPDLIKAFLEQIDFLNYLEESDTCEIRDKIMSLKNCPKFTINNKNLKVMNIIGKGSYGTVYCAQDNSGKMYALKQEKPANLWEYYICLELRSRIKNVDIIKSFMDIECSIIANNSSIFVSEFSKFGSLITVCNKIKRVTTKNVNEFVVMILTDQILSIVDHLHSCHIIHADIKPDNIVLMNEIKFDTVKPVIQLIDYGVSIDMDLFQVGHTFKYNHIKDNFNCIEMKENRPWTYQIDLYGIACVIHVLLFGKYMVVEKTSIWQPTQKIPRYFNKPLWETIFSQLLNIRDCNTLPNLQNLRKLLKEELLSKEKFVMEKIREFNYALYN